LSTCECASAVVLMEEFLLPRLRRCRQFCFSCFHAMCQPYRIKPRAPDEAIQSKSAEVSTTSGVSKTATPTSSARSRKQRRSIQMLSWVAPFSPAAGEYYGECCRLPLVCRFTDLVLMEVEPCFTDVNDDAKGSKFGVLLVPVLDSNTVRKYSGASYNVRFRTPTWT
jgi:hypothetical protein